MLSLINFFLIVFLYILVFCIALKRDTNELKLDNDSEVSEVESEVSEVSSEVESGNSEVQNEVSLVNSEQAAYEAFMKQVHGLYDAVAEVNQKALERLGYKPGTDYDEWYNTPKPEFWVTSNNPKEPLGAVDSVEELHAANAEGAEDAGL